MVEQRRAVVAVDVDGVIAVDPESADGVEELAGKGYERHEFDRPGSDGQPVRGSVWLRAEHGAWLRELAERGAELVWATSWNQVAADWLAPRLGLPVMPVIEVPDWGARFGWSAKRDPIHQWVGGRPLAWIDDTWGGKEFGWAEDRRDQDGIPTLLVDIEWSRGLEREDIERVLAWLDTEVATSGAVAAG